MTELKYTIPLDPRTKKNHQIIAGSGARCPRCGKPERLFIRQGAAHDEYVQAAALFLRPRPREPISRPVRVRAVFYMKTRRTVDQLNLLAAVDDLLVDTGVLADDNVKIVHDHDGSRVYYDRDHPRTEITITSVETEGE